MHYPLIGSNSPMMYSFLGRAIRPLMNGNPNMVQPLLGYSVRIDKGSTQFGYGIYNHGGMMQSIGKRAGVGIGTTLDDGSYMRLHYYRMSVDSLSTSELASMYYASEKTVANATMISGKEVKQLKVEDNVLELNQGEYYKLIGESGRTFIYHNSNASDWMETDYVGYTLNFGIDFQSFSDEYRDEQAENRKFLNELVLHGLRGWSSRSRSEDKEMLDRLGVKPGWFTIRNDGKERKYWVEENGGIHTWTDLEADRVRLNSIDFFGETTWNMRKDRQGLEFTTNTVFTVNGEEYRLDETGHLNIPEGVPVFWHEIEIRG